MSSNFVLVGYKGPTRPRNGESRAMAREATIRYKHSIRNACRDGYCQLGSLSAYGVASLFNTNQF